MSKITEKQAQTWIEINAPEYKIIIWGGSATQKTLWERKGNKFYCSFSELKTRLKSGIIPGNTKQEIIEKTKKTNIKRYGKTCSLANPKIKNKAKQTFIKRYGTENPFANSEIKKKIKQTNLKKYGNEYHQGLTHVRKKVTETMIKKYGVEHVSQIPSTKNKIKEQRIKSGFIKLINGKSLKEIAEEKQIGYSTIQSLYKKTNDEDLILNFEKTQTSCEKKISLLLKQVNIDYIFDSYIKESKEKIKPDFKIDSNKLIIECDGLWYHSEVFKDKNYHLKRKNYYNKLGYNSLFFYDYEVLNKSDIVNSIIKNKLGLSKKIYARKCNIFYGCESNFFEKNHLMGKGQGKIYSIKYGKEIVSAMQVKWKNKKIRQLEISRFCHKLNHNIVGGFTKLVSAIIKNEKPTSIITFIDKRYGNGNYLSNMGWVQKSNNLSFKWTNGKEFYHRMKFPGNKGYDYGLKKIWDCGQTKWELKKHIH